MMELVAVMERATALGSVTLTGGTGNFEKALTGGRGEDGHSV